MILHGMSTWVLCYRRPVSKTRRVFIGMSGPFGFDYGHPTDWTASERESSPNPVLEDVTGLLLCYDELWFVSRHVCPADLRDLPYVRFVSDDADRATKAADAASTTRLLLKKEEALGRQFSFGHFGALSRRMSAGDASFAIDNHTHSVDLLPGLQTTVNAANLENIVVDSEIAANLDLGPIDVVSNTIAMSAICQDVGLYHDGNEFTATRRAIASSIAELRVPNLLGPKGAYWSSIEDLRSHRNVREFRDFLSEVEIDESVEAAKLAQEVSKLAKKAAHEALKRHVRGRNKYVTVGAAGVGFGLNRVAPGGGSVVGGAFNLLRGRADANHAQRRRWALFVLDALASD